MGEGVDFPRVTSRETTSLERQSLAKVHMHPLRSCWEFREIPTRWSVAELFTARIALRGFAHEPNATQNRQSNR